VNHHSMTHDEPLVFLSFAVALLASYTALDMGTRFSGASGKARKLWLGGSSVVLGGGIWSMHFIAMLAFNVGVPVGYDFDLTALSLIIAIGIVAVGFYVVARTNPSIPRQIVGGCIVGCGVAIMHYTGMAALVLPGTIHYDPVLVGVSVLVAIVAATAALWLTLNVANSWQRVAAAAIMAVAVCGMHYTAMSATSIAISPDQVVTVHPLSRPILAAAVSIGLFLILCLAMVCVLVDRRFELLAEREAENLRAANLRLRGEISERQAIALELRASNTALTDTQGAIRSLLDNAVQGFLTITPDLLVGDQCSAACMPILGEAPAGKPIVDLLCRSTPHDTQAGMCVTLQSVFRDASDFTRGLKLGLLPTTFDLDGRSIEVRYKFLADSNRLMLILTDVTQTALLSEAVDRERQRLDMIVLAFTEGEAFAALVNDYKQFLTDELPKLVQQTDNLANRDELYRQVHTYKGLLSQFSFHRSPRCLHEVETTLSAEASRRPLAANDVIRPEALFLELTRDLTTVSDVLGPDFVPSARRVILSQHQLRAMEQVARDVLASDVGRTASQPLRHLLQSLARLEMLDVKAALALHSRGASALAARLNKQLEPIRIQGDDLYLPPELFSKFFRSFVHVFRNAVDHGIEALRSGPMAGGKAWREVAPDVAQAASGGRCCERRDRGTDADGSGRRRSVPGRLAARSD
jgi:NO-binding membrane sensor protein with MHYT domain